MRKEQEQTIRILMESGADCAQNRGKIFNAFTDGIEVSLILLQALKIKPEQLEDYIALNYLKEESTEKWRLRMKRMKNVIAAFALEL